MRRGRDEGNAGQCREMENEMGRNRETELRDGIRPFTRVTLSYTNYSHQYHCTTLYFARDRFGMFVLERPK